MSWAVQHKYEAGAEDVSGVGGRTIDIRGTQTGPAIAPILADPSGVRARRLTRAGRAIALLCLLWLVGLGLAGIGILPADDLPLGRAITGAARQALGVAGVPTPSRFDAPGARTASYGAASGAAGRIALTRSVAQPAAGARQDKGRGVSYSDVPGHLPTRSTARRSEPGLSESASAVRGSGMPGETISAPSGATGGESQAAAVGPGAYGSAAQPGRPRRAATPGHSDGTARGNSASAPGQVRPTRTTVIPAPGHSGSSPGHTMASGGGHGNRT